MFDPEIMPDQALKIMRNKKIYFVKCVRERVKISFREIFFLHIYHNQSINLSITPIQVEKFYSSQKTKKFYVKKCKIFHKRIFKISIMIDWKFFFVVDQRMCQMMTFEKNRKTKKNQ